MCYRRKSPLPCTWKGYINIAQHLEAMNSLHVRCLEEIYAVDA